VGTAKVERAGRKASSDPSGDQFNDAAPF